MNNIVAILKNNNMVAAGFSLRFLKYTQAKACGYQSIKYQLAKAAA